MAEEIKDRNMEDRHSISRSLWYLYIGFFITSLIIIGRIIYIQFFWEPDERFEHYFVSSVSERIVEPKRGSVMDCNGKLLATSKPSFDVYMDCAVRKEYYRDLAKKDSARDTLETRWRKDARLLADGLADILSDRGKSADQYYRLIINGRDKDVRYASIVKDIDLFTLSKLKALPIFNRGDQYHSGMIVREKGKRETPYGSLAARTIGYVAIDEDNYTKNRYIGIDGEFDHILHGKEGKEWVRQTDKGEITHVDSSSIAVQDGADIRTTLDIDIQDIADKALRKHIGTQEDIESGCVIVMDVETGAVKAMVNLYRNKENEFREIFNMAIGRPGEPGSVFKSVTLMNLIEDGHVKLETQLPTNGGVTPYFSNKFGKDEYILKYERNTKKKKISVIDGFEISSNYVFRKLIYDYYGDNPKSYIDRLYEYGMHDYLDFDLKERGMGSPSVPNPDKPGWGATDLGSTAIGYTVSVTPLHIVNFYNALANKGKMMKPYIIDSFEKDGKTIEKFEPEVMQGSICSKATADTMTRALMSVVKEGTASKLKTAKCSVAGKTGTARVVLDESERKGSRNPYESIDGKKRHQGTFVGYFPAKDPKYTAIVVVYSRLTKKNFYGGDIPAYTLKDIVDALYTLDPEWSREMKAGKYIPDMEKPYIGVNKKEYVPVPDVMGYGLKDALYAIENNGYKCRYEGVGHVVSQTPEGGAEADKGETITIVLK